MCCLFGVMDPNHTFHGKALSRIVRALSVAAEQRGTDATGIAYHAGGRLEIRKRPLPAHLLRFRIPDGTRAVMGHTRMTTQGDEKQNRNNHPFLGCADGGAYALAHNGVIWNDLRLREAQKLPQTEIQTDSYIAVQLLDQAGTVDFSSLKAMAEAVEGSFTFTVLDRRGRLFFVKGDNPLCLYHWKRSGVYLYASTEEILQSALAKLRLSLGKPRRIELGCGDILCIDASGQRSAGSFDPSGLLACRRACYPPYFSGRDFQAGYLRDLKSAAAYCGIEPKTIDALLRDGWSFDELEEMIYAGEL